MTGLPISQRAERTGDGIPEPERLAVGGNRTPREYHAPGSGRRPGTMARDGPGIRSAGIQERSVSRVPAHARREPGRERRSPRRAEGLARHPLRRRRGGPEGRALREGPVPRRHRQGAVDSLLLPAADAQHARSRRAGPYAPARARSQGIHAAPRRADGRAHPRPDGRPSRRSGPPRTHGPDPGLRVADPGHDHRRDAGRPGGRPAPFPALVQCHGLRVSLGLGHAPGDPGRFGFHALHSPARPLAPEARRRRSGQRARAGGRGRADARRGRAARDDLPPSRRRLRDHREPDRQRDPRPARAPGRNARGSARTRLCSRAPSKSFFGTTGPSRRPPSATRSKT